MTIHQEINKFKTTIIIGHRKKCLFFQTQNPGSVLGAASKFGSESNRPLRNEAVICTISYLKYDLLSAVFATRGPLYRVITAAAHSIDIPEGCVKKRFRDGEKKVIKKERRETEERKEENEREIRR